jgi:hypothetical protein
MNLTSIDEDDEDEFYSDSSDIWRYCRLLGAPSAKVTTGGDAGRRLVEEHVRIEAQGELPRAYIHVKCVMF